ncbi:MAG: phosphate ABC transporter substrate-binding protein, partial [Myxococcales bacterium]|nr:phosphate ABC transporter substrate-binding protein [Myxococcales bacterium]
MHHHELEDARWRWPRLSLALLIALIALGCSGRRGSERQRQEQGASARGGGTLTVKGSDTMVILAQRWAEAFMEANEGVSVQVAGGGSGTGIAALINGTTDLANASRELKARERTQIRERVGREAQQTRVALDALAIYVHAENGLASLTIPQLRGIFRGEITNFREVGGPDLPIVIYSRENSSGTYAYFKEHVLDDLDFAPQAQTLPGTAAVINAIGQDRGGIGYGGIAYAAGVRAIRVAAEGGEAVEPTMQNATRGRYPLARYLHIDSAGAPEGLAARYLEF